MLEKAETDSEKGFEVLPENWKAVRIFLMLQTQWVVNAAGGAMGLDYSSLETVMRLYRVKNVKKVFEQIQVIESGALVALAEKRKGAST